ncbi:formate transporter domain protein [Shigella sonnei 53G]|nr:formate transporter domain protein [Shigella sonnei 53G]
MRNKLSFDLQLSARKAAIAERITAHKIARSKVSVFLMAMSAGVFMAIGFTFTFPLSPMPRLHRH